MRGAAFGLFSLLALACGPASAPVPPAAAPPAPPPSAPPAASAAAAPRPDESFREHPPAPETARPFVIPTASRALLRNGIPVLFVRQPSPFVAIRVVAAGGVADVGTDHVEVVNQLLTAFRAGTGPRSLNDVRAELITLGLPEPKTSWGPDGVSVSVLARAEKAHEGVDFAADFALHPAFDEKTLLRWRDMDAQTQAASSDDARAAENVLHRVLFGGHPYAGWAISSKRTAAVTRAQIAALHARLFDASRLSIVVAGDAKEKDVIADLDATFGSLPRMKRWNSPAAPPAPPPGPRVIVVDKPGTTIATILVGAAGPAYAAPDDLAASLAIDALADSWFGRLTTRLRDKLGYVPWVTPMSSAVRAGGWYGWRTRASTEHVGPLLAEMDRVVRDFVANGPSEQDFADLRMRGTVALDATFETAESTAAAFSRPLLSQLPDDFLAKQQERAASVSAADVTTAAARYLTPDRLRIVIVGDWATLKAQLDGLGWGPAQLRDELGAVVSPTGAPRATK